MAGLILTHQGKTPEIADSAFIAATATLIGTVDIGPRASIWYNVVLRGDDNDITVGADTNIQDGTVVHIDSRLQGATIGAGITIGHMALIHACTLEDGCFIGMKACVMDGAVIERGAMVAAGALVTPGKRVPAGELWSGVPARPMRRLSPVEATQIARSAEHYVGLALRHRADQRARLTTPKKA